MIVTIVIIVPGRAITPHMHSCGICQACERRMISLARGAIATATSVAHTATTIIACRT